MLRYWLIVAAFVGFSACTSQKKVNQNSSQAERIDVSYGTPAPSKSAYNPERTRPHDLLHTRLEVSFDWKKRHLIGNAQLTIKPYFYPQDSLKLDAKGFEVKTVAIKKEGKNINLPYRYDGKVIATKLDKTYTKEEQFIVEISYIAKPDEQPLGGSAAITQDKGLYFINPDGTEPNKPRQIWTQGETEANSKWFPTFDTPNERCTQEIFITIDTAYITLSNGILVSSILNENGTRTDYWKQDQPHAPYLFMMGIGKFAVVKDKWKNLEVNYYVEPEYAPHAKAIFGRTPEMITFFSEKLGVNYPWKKYSQMVVRDYVSGAMENTSASIFMEALQVDSRELLDSDWDDIIAHELFHQWFGNLVTCESWANLPLNEAFANYSEYLWREYKKGTDEADLHSRDELEQYLGESKRKQEPLIRYHHHDKEDMFDSHSYAKGGRTLHTLRNYVGDEAFFASLKKYLETHQYTSVEIHDLRLAFEDVVGEDLNWFFNQWFLTPGHPKVEVTENYKNKNVELTIRQLQDTTYSTIYRLPIKVTIWEGEKSTTHSIVLDKPFQTFTLPAAQKPSLVLFDSDYQMLGEIIHNKTSEELLHQFKYAKRGMQRLEALEALAEKKDSVSIDKIMGVALKDKFWKIRETAIDILANAAEKRITPHEYEIKQLATEDKKSHVRAAAVELLTAYNAEDNVAIFEKALNDSSYRVVSAAVSGYIASGAKDVAQKLGQFEKIQQPAVQSAVAEYYAETGSSDKYDWFVKAVKAAKNEGSFALMQYFGIFLMKNPDKQTDGLKLLEQTARNHSSMYLRFAAYQTMSLFVNSQNNLKKTMKDIREKETSKVLQQYYDLYVPIKD